MGQEGALCAAQYTTQRASVSGSWHGWRRGDRLAAVLSWRGRDVEQPAQQVERQREDDGAVLLGRDLGERLQIAQLQGGRLRADDLRGRGQRLRGVVLAFS